MQNANEPSIEKLRKESERNREALASTVTELRDRVGDTTSELKTLVSPAHIRQEIRDYVRQERGTIVESLKRRAKENPLQIAAITAAAAYPALGIIRTVPAPLWLIGAGLFLTSRRGQQAALDVKAKVDNAVLQGTEKVSDLASSVQSDLENHVAQARYGVQEAQDAVSSTVRATTEKARTAFHDATGAVVGPTGDAAVQAKVPTDGLDHIASQTAQSVLDGARGAVATTRNTVTNLVSDNALLVAGIGAALGAFIAASIPPSDAENSMFGAGSEKLKDKAREAAAQGIENAGDIAAEAAGAMAAAATREGLDASGVQGALGKVADSVRAVADRGLETALGQAQSPQSATRQTEQEPIRERNPS
jgi:hypothetical protein